MPTHHHLLQLHLMHHLLPPYVMRRALTARHVAPSAHLQTHHHHPMHVAVHHRVAVQLLHVLEEVGEQAVPIGGQQMNASSHSPLP